MKVSCQLTNEDYQQKVCNSNYSQLYVYIKFCMYRYIHVHVNVYLSVSHALLFIGPQASGWHQIC